jgi:class 3 adenylate cyclase
LLLRQMSRKTLACYCLLLLLCSAARGQQSPERQPSCTDSLARVNLTLGENLIAQSRRDSAQVILQQTVACARQLDDGQILARALVALGRIELGKIGPRDTPTKLFLEALSIYTALGDDRGIASCNLQLGVLSYDIKNYPAAERYFQQVLMAREEGKRFQSVARYLLALTYSELKKYELAEQTFDLAAGEVDPKDSMFHLQLLTFKGKMYANQGEPDKAIALLNQVLTDYRPTIRKEEYAPVYAFLSSAHFQAGHLREAIAHGERAYALCKANTSNSIYLRETENTLHQAYRQSGDYPRAYYYLEALQALDDSVFNVQALQRVAQMSGEYEFEQQRKLQQAEQALKDQLAKQELDRQKRWRNLLLLGFLFVTGSAIVFLRQRTRIAQERDRSDKLLLNILPEEIADELKARGSAEARHFEQASVLFTDFKGFTEQSALLSAADLVREINACFEAFDAIMVRHGIEKIKTIGDAYMAAGGLPIPSDDAAKKTVLAALEMQRFIQTRNGEQAARDLPFFEMRLGIHTGPVVAGIVGSWKFQYDIWGDTVNTASRMESHGVPGRVQITQSTWQLVEPDYVCEPRGLLEVKGKGPVPAWLVVARRS